MSSDLDAIPVLQPISTWKLVGNYIGGLAPGLIVWVVLVGWLVSLLNYRAEWSVEADHASVQEWLSEARPFRKTLPELVREYEQLRRLTPLEPNRLQIKRAEIREQIRSMVEPTRIYQGQLPTFPLIYNIEVRFPPISGSPNGDAETILWDSPLPHSRETSDEIVRNRVRLTAGSGTEIICEYQMHAFNKLQQRQIEQRRESLVAAAVLLAATLLAGLFTYRFLRRERQREFALLTGQAEAEHRRRELLEARVQQQEADLQRDELERSLLGQKLEAATLKQRADEAEKSTLEMKSQLFASIGIMAGSYAHNIKNLLVRPNDLLVRCLEVDGLPREQAGMLNEVRSTLGTVTDRLQQILRTVRRDPGDTELTRIDLAALIRDTAVTWSEMGRDKWKVSISATVPNEPLWVRGDVSHLQQAIENLVFNSRDATFEKRNHLRELARQTAEVDPAARKQRLIEAAGWKGEITLRARRDAGVVLLEVQDNGVGMTEEVRANCLRSHFTTKRDNAIYSGNSAGMGLGLSFVAMVLDHHHAELTVDSTAGVGTTFRIRFPTLTDNPESAQPSRSTGSS